MSWEGSSAVTLEPSLITCPYLLYPIIFNHRIAESMSAEKCEYLWKVDLYSIYSARYYSDAYTEFPIK